MLKASVQLNSCSIFIVVDIFSNVRIMFTIKTTTCNAVVI